jgi:cellulose synthase/poly-beta-1,6-N-acetylglucosamine synthase-like glycosyltransferase
MGSGAEVLPTELSEPRNVDYGGAEALLVRRELFVELGGFDQAYDPAYFEDVDLCLRLRAAGWTIVYEPSAVVVHHRSMSTREDLVWREFAAERSMAVFSEHWGPLLSNAARVDDPPVVLMPVPPDYGLRPLNFSEQVAASRDVGALDGKRQREFRDWIGNRLSHASARVEEEESRCKELEMANEQLRSRLQALEDRLGMFEQLQTHAAAQKQELTDLVTGPLHVLLRRRARAWLRSRRRVHRMVVALRARRR